MNVDLDCDKYAFGDGEFHSFFLIEFEHFNADDSDDVVDKMKAVFLTLIDSK